MPTITATVHQILRYFFVGALATAFVAVPPGECWSLRFTSFLTNGLRPSAPLVGIAMLIGGSLIYLAHRVIVYPWIFRHFVLLRVLGEETTEKRWRRLFWPYGKAVSGELYLERLGSRLAQEERERFVGWASEIHLCYLATEIALFTLLAWPRWPRPYPPGWVCGLGLFVLLFLVAAWDRQSVSVLVDQARRSPVPR